MSADNDNNRSSGADKKLPHPYNVHVPIVLETWREGEVDRNNRVYSRTGLMELIQQSHPEAVMDKDGRIKYVASLSPEQHAALMNGNLRGAYSMSAMLPAESFNDGVGFDNNIDHSKRAPAHIPFVFACPDEIEVDRILHDIESTAILLPVQAEDERWKPKPAKQVLLDIVSARNAIEAGAGRAPVLTTLDRWRMYAESKWLSEQLDAPRKLKKEWNRAGTAIGPRSARGKKAARDAARRKHREERAAIVAERIRLAVIGVQSRKGR